MYARILVPVDGSAASRRGLEEALKAAAAAAARAHVEVETVERMSGGRRVSDAILAEARKWRAEPARAGGHEEAEHEERKHSVEQQPRVRPHRRHAPGERRMPRGVARGEIEKPPPHRRNRLERAEKEQDPVRLRREQPPGARVRGPYRRPQRGTARHPKRNTPWLPATAPAIVRTLSASSARCSRSTSRSVPAVSARTRAANQR